MLLPKVMSMFPHCQHCFPHRVENWRKLAWALDPLNRDMKAVNILLAVSAVIFPFVGYIYVGRLARAIAVTTGMFVFFVVSGVITVEITEPAIDPSQPVFVQAIAYIGFCALIVVHGLVRYDIAKDMIRINEQRQTQKASNL